MNIFFTTWLVLIATLGSLYTATFVMADPCNALNDAIYLRSINNAFYVSNLWAGRSNEQRVAIVQAYQNQYKQNLFDRFNSVSDDYLRLLKDMAKPLPLFLADDLWTERDFFHSDSNAAVDILSTSSNALNKAIYEAGKRLEGETFEEYLNDQFMWLHYPRTQYATNRDESPVNNSLVSADAENVYQGVTNKQSKGDLRQWIEVIIGTRSYQHLHQLIHKYKELHGQEIEIALTKFTSDEFITGAKKLIEIHRSVPDYYAKRLNAILIHKHLIMSRRQLRRIILLRSTIDMNDIREAFQRMFPYNLDKLVDFKANDEFGRLLVRLMVNYSEMVDKKSKDI